MSQTFKEYENVRAEALKEFHDFLERCAEKGFTVQQLTMIGTFANEEIQKAITNMHTKVKFTVNQCDPLQHKHE